MTFLSVRHLTPQFISTPLYDGYIKFDPPLKLTSDDSTVIIRGTSVTILRHEHIDYWENEGGALHECEISPVRVLF